MAPLCHLSSGRQAIEQVADDMLNAYNKGKSALMNFVKERLEKSKTKV